MRKIEEQMLEAIRKNRNFKCRNTEVKSKNGFSKVYLHGNHIATYCRRFIDFNLCGWNTPTTRSRLNAIGVNINQRNFKPYCNGVEINVCGWYRFSNFES